MGCPWPTNDSMAPLQLLGSAAAAAHHAALRARKRWRLHGTALVEQRPDLGPQFLQELKISATEICEELVFDACQGKLPKIVGCSMTQEREMLVHIPLERNHMQGYKTRLCAKTFSRKRS